MKKYVNLVFIFIYISLFFLIYQAFVEEDNSNIHTNFGGVKKYNTGSIEFSEKIDEKDLEKIVEIAKTISDKYGIYFQVEEYIRGEGDDNTKEIKYYISGSDKFVSDLLPSEVQVPENFCSSDYYISSLKDNNPNNISFFSFYKNTTYSIYPMKALENQYKGVFTNLVYFYNDSTDAVKIIEDNFKDFSFEFMNLGAEKFDKDTKILNSYILYSIILLVTTLLHIFFTISNKSKAIMVYKLNGYKTSHIAFELFRGDLLINILSLILVPLLGTTIVIGEFNSRVLELIMYGYLFLFLLFLVFTFCMFLGVKIISLQKISDFIKKKNFNRGLTKFSFILMLVISCILLPKTNMPIHNIYEILTSKIKINKLLDTSSNVSGLRLKLTKDRNWEYNQHLVSQGGEDQVYNKHLAIYKELNNKGYIYKQRASYEDITDYEKLDQEAEPIMVSILEINEKFLNVNTFKNAEDNVIDFQLKGDCIYVLMPENLFKIRKWSSKDFSLRENVNMKMLLYSKVKGPNYNFQEQIDMYDPIYLLEKDGGNLLNNSIDYGIYIDNKYYDKTIDLLKNTGIYDSLEFYDNKDLLNEANKAITTNLIRVILELLPLIIVFMTTLNAMKNFYIISETKRLAILKMIGYKSVEASKFFVIDLLALLVLTILYEVVVSHELYYYSLVFLLIIVIYNYFRLKVYYKKLEVPSVLGG